MQQSSQKLETDCCIVGGGPAGLVLAYLLARQGVQVTLLEAKKDFDRDFRGDSISPLVMEIMASLNLAEPLFKLRHSKVRRLTYVTPQGSFVISNFTHLKTDFPFLTVLPQADFLEFIAKEAEASGNFKLKMEAPVHELIFEEGFVRGVRYQEKEGVHELRAKLLIGADGRASRIRKRGGFEFIPKAPPMDLLSFRLPGSPVDPEEADLKVYTGPGYYVGLWNRFDYWQFNFSIPKGSYPDIRTRGIEAFQNNVGRIFPDFIDRVNHLQEWPQISFLSVQAGSVSKWYRPGLLLIGDSAHVMSPAGGVGINCAIEDAVATANVIIKPLLEGTLQTSHLAQIERKRRWPIQILQTLQAMAQKSFIAKALCGKSFSLPLSFHIPFVRHWATRVTCFGISPVRVLKQ